MCFPPCWKTIRLIFSKRGSSTCLLHCEDISWVKDSFEGSWQWSNTLVCLRLDLLVYRHGPCSNGASCFIALPQNFPLHSWSILQPEQPWWDRFLAWWAAALLWKFAMRQPPDHKPSPIFPIGVKNAHSIPLDFYQYPLNPIKSCWTPIHLYLNPLIHGYPPGT